MACVVASSAAVAPSALAAATPSSAVQTSSIQSFTGLKSAGVFAAKSVSLSSKAVSNGSRVQCMQVWTPINNPKFETLSYLPALTPTKIAKEIDYMLANKWVPCLEFDPVGVISRKHHKSPGYYDGRYWTMWKLPMFGCTDSAPVLREIELVKKEYPNCYIRVLGFDNVRQVQCSAFIVHKPAARPPTQPGGQVRPRQGPAPVSAPKLPQLPQLSQISQISGPVFRPPASSSFPGEALDWDALTAVGKAVERLVSPGTPHPSSLREQRWRRMQAAASELTGLSGAIAAHSVAHELFIQELEDLIELLSRASTRR